MVNYSDSAGVALAAQTLAVGILGALKAKGILSLEEMNELLEQSLLMLETFQGEVPQEDHQPYQTARVLLEQIRDVLNR